MIFRFASPALAANSYPKNECAEKRAVFGKT
jgi:hypothetical protein